MEIDLFTPESSLSELIWQWLNSNRFRIVKFDIGSVDAEDWFLLQRISNGRFIGTNGADRGASGQFNNQLNNACNPVALVGNIAEIARHFICGRSVMNWGRDRLPRAEVIEEIDIPETVNRLVRLGNQPFGVAFLEFFGLQMKCASFIAPTEPARQANLLHRAIAAFSLDSI